MKSILILVVIVISAFIFPFSVNADDFLNTPLGKEVVNLGLRFLDNPGDFLFNLHSDNVDFTPVLKNRHGTIRTNFYPTTLPTIWLNLNVKVKTLSDSGYAPWVPQVDVLAQYGRGIGIDMASSMMTKDSTETVKPSMQDYAVGLILTKSVADNTRLYAGFNYSNVNLNIKLDKAIEFSAFSMKEMNVNVTDTFIVTGIENKIRENKYVIAHLGYGLRYQKIVSRIAWYSKHLELGFNIYPEGLFVMHPFMSWHWYF